MNDAAYDVLPDNSVKAVAARKDVTAIIRKVRCSSLENSKLIAPNRDDDSPELLQAPCVHKLRSISAFMSN